MKSISYTGVYGASIRGVGTYIPEGRIFNEEISKYIGKDPEWIYEKTGIKSRCIAKNYETNLYMSVKASERAIQNSGISVQDIDLIIHSCVVPEHVNPATSCKIQFELKAKNAACIDIRVGGCPGGSILVNMAANFIASGSYKNILVISSDKVRDNIVDIGDKSTSIFFGDGAGALIVSRVKKGVGISAYCMGADGSGYDSIKVEAGGSRLPITKDNVGDKDLTSVRMNGREVYKFVTDVVPNMVRSILNVSEYDLEDVKMILFHQANINLIGKILDDLNLTWSRSHTTIEKYGNLSGASLFVTLEEILEKNTIESGDKIMLVSFGAGLQWSGTLIKWPDEQDFL